MGPCDLSRAAGAARIHFRTTMSKTYRLDHYGEGSFDRYLCLKPPMLLWVAIIYLSRAFLLPLVVALSSMKGGGVSDSAELIHGAFSPGALLAAVPVLFVLYAFIRRTPSGSTGVRWIWRHGQAFLALAALLDLGYLVFATGALHGQLTSLDMLTLLSLAFDIYFLIYVLAARRVRDVFSDFPPATVD